MFWKIIPDVIIRDWNVNRLNMVLLLFQMHFVTKAVQSYLVLNRMKRLTPHVFANFWWAIVLNIIPIFVIYNAVGMSWYVLAIERFAGCLYLQCQVTDGCKPLASCSVKVCPQGLFSAEYNCENPTNVQPFCYGIKGPFPFGIYIPELQSLTSDSWRTKIVHSVGLGVNSLSTFGGALDPSMHDPYEVFFCICIALIGVGLMGFFLGNIQLLADAYLRKGRKTKNRCREVEWWLEKRGLPESFKKIIRKVEDDRMKAIGGDVGLQILEELPPHLRIQLQQHLRNKIH